MKKLSITTALILGLVFSGFSQADTMYVVEAGLVVYKRATSSIDSVTFKNPTVAVATGAKVGDYRDGGIVFWVDPTDSTKGLVVDLNDFSATAHWGCSLTLISGADGFAVGTGAQNTLDILAGCSEVGTAADLCAKSTSGGYSDWFLPSKDELNEISRNKSVIDAAAISNGGGGFIVGIRHFYWTSTEYDDSSAWGNHVNPNVQGASGKHANQSTRAVRAF